MNEAYDIRVEGMVQGVGFRYFTLFRARRRGITGWVRNEYDGSVAVRAEGPSEDLNDFIEELRRGPAGARVRRLEAVPVPPAGTFADFDVRF